MGGYYYLYRTPQGASIASTTTQAKSPHPKEEEKNIPGNVKDAPPFPAGGTFKGGDQGWIDLKLDKVETLSHNTKRFRFLLPDPDEVSGLRVACMF